MGNTVILAEKPSQAKAYTDAFAKVEKKDGYYNVSDNELPNATITYGYGHLLSLSEPEKYNAAWKKWQLDKLPVFPEHYQFQVAAGKSKQYKIVKGLLDKADKIIIATDSDREGEAIARLIINLSGNNHKPIKRLWINSLETSEIKNGFKHLKDGADFYSTYKEAETRQIADWLVGINLSRLYTLYMQKNGLQGVFSIGRVQTPTLYLIYQRNQEIEHFVSKPFFELYATFSNEDRQYQGKYKERFDTIDDLQQFKENHGLTKDVNGVVEDVKIEEKKKYAPKLFSLSDLQAAANKKYGYGASESLAIVQNLYEKKYLSYPRTDTNYIGTPEFSYLKAQLVNYLNLVGEEIKDPQLNENKRYVNGKKVQEHYAIIPTKTLPKLESLPEKERNIYQLVLYRTLAIFEEPYIYDETTILTKASGVLFKSTGKVEKILGWKQLYKKLGKESKDNENEQVLPAVKVGELFRTDPFHKKGETKPPSYYTEGTLIRAMKNVGRSIEDEDNKDILKETEGIGTEATRANIIETLKKQEYINIQKNKIYVTQKGMTLCEIIQNDEIANSEMTAKWEKYLKKIRHRQGTQEAFLKSIQNFITHLVKKVPETFEHSHIKEQATKIDQNKVIGKCPSCSGNILDKGKFYGCTGYSNGCRFSLPKKWSSKTLTKTNIKELLTKQETSLIKGFKSKKGYIFNAKLKINNNKLEFDFLDSN
ncbi:type IA DNA topoisomerase [Pisciglobus halotolerans]|uniref:DNA topoisomerase n=1 Tax=Pisciglobus halotolerans TaxID=745365 RepID=A0A1I3DB31_9LACT|nr:type IA DNA topoisomerase [Pisciglobus halotolerans]SFH83758.1 DNA topoisomerase-3 [Pisciglobus halotolerans]